MTGSMNATRISSLLVALLTMAAALADDGFRDCEACPVMVPLPAGRFLMGSAPEDRLIDPRTGKPATNDGPQHAVALPAFAVGRYEITVGEYQAFVEATGHRNIDPCMGFTEPDRFSMSRDFDWDHIDTEQSDRHPVGCVSWFDAVAYTDWLSDRTGADYRLPTEAEWEYAARAGATTPYHWGVDEAAACTFANVRSPGAQSISQRQSESDRVDGFPCDDGAAAAAPVGQFRPNGFGLFDMQGNAWEWVADCNHKDYVGAPADGSAWLDDSGCQFGLIRGGSFLNRVERSSTTVRVGRPRAGRGTNMGFRVVRGADAPATSPDARPFISDAGIDADQPGGQLFNEYCQACHQQRDNFRGLYGREQAAVEHIIRSGGNNIMSMPAFGDLLSADQIRVLAAYVRARNGWR